MEAVVFTLNSELARVMVNERIRRHDQQRERVRTSLLTRPEPRTTR